MSESLPVRSTCSDEEQTDTLYSRRNNTKERKNKSRPSASNENHEEEEGGRGNDPDPVPERVDNASGFTDSKARRPHAHAPKERGEGGGGTLVPMRAQVGSLSLSSARLQVLCYVLAELCSASTLLQDYTRAMLNLPHRLLACWQGVMAAAVVWQRCEAKLRRAAHRLARRRRRHAAMRAARLYDDASGGQGRRAPKLRRVETFAPAATASKAATYKEKATQNSDVPLGATGSATGLACGNESPAAPLRRPPSAKKQVNPPPRLPRDLRIAFSEYRELEDAVGRRVEAARRLVVAALFQQYLHVMVLDSANDLVLCAWLRPLRASEVARGEAAVMQAAVAHACAELAESEADKYSDGGADCEGAERRPPEGPSSPRAQHLKRQGDAAMTAATPTRHTLRSASAGGRSAQCTGSGTFLTSPVQQTSVSRSGHLRTSALGRSHKTMPRSASSSKELFLRLKEQGREAQHRFVDLSDVDSEDGENGGEEAGPVTAGTGTAAGGLVSMEEARFTSPLKSLEAVGSDSVLRSPMHHTTPKSRTTSATVSGDKRDRGTSDEAHNDQGRTIRHETQNSAHRHEASEYLKALPLSTEADASCAQTTSVHAHANSQAHSNDEGRTREPEKTIGGTTGNAEGDEDAPDGGRTPHPFPIPLRFFMRAAASFDPTACAFSLMCRCVLLARTDRTACHEEAGESSGVESEVDDDEDADRRSAEGGSTAHNCAEREELHPGGVDVAQPQGPHSHQKGVSKPTQASSPSTNEEDGQYFLSQPRAESSEDESKTRHPLHRCKKEEDQEGYFYVVIARRAVGGCHHARPCFGNRKFIFAACDGPDVMVRGASVDSTKEPSEAEEDGAHSGGIDEVGKTTTAVPLHEESVNPSRTMDVPPASVSEHPYDSTASGRPAVPTGTGTDGGAGATQSTSIPVPGTGTHGSHSSPTASPFSSPPPPYMTDNWRRRMLSFGKELTEAAKPFIGTGLPPHLHTSPLPANVELATSDMGEDSGGDVRQPYLSPASPHTRHVYREGAEDGLMQTHRRHPKHSHRERRGAQGHQLSETCDNAWERDNKDPLSSRRRSSLERGMQDVPEALPLCHDGSPLIDGLTHTCHGQDSTQTQRLLSVERPQHQESILLDEASDIASSRMGSPAFPGASAARHPSSPPMNTQGPPRTALSFSPAADVSSLNAGAERLPRQQRNQEPSVWDEEASNASEASYSSEEEEGVSFFIFYSDYCSIVDPPPNERSPRDHSSMYRDQNRFRGECGEDGATVGSFNASGENEEHHEPAFEDEGQQLLLKSAEDLPLPSPSNAATPGALIVVERPPWSGGLTARPEPLQSSSDALWKGGQDGPPDPLTAFEQTVLMPPAGGQSFVAAHGTQKATTPQRVPPAAAGVPEAEEGEVVPSDGDLAFAQELFARLHFWCLRGQSRDAFVDPSHYTGEDEGKTTTKETGATGEDRFQDGWAAHHEEQVSLPLKLLNSDVGTITFSTASAAPQNLTPLAEEDGVNGSEADSDAGSEVDDALLVPSTELTESTRGDHTLEGNRHRRPSRHGTLPPPPGINASAGFNLKGQHLLYEALLLSTEAVVVATRESRAHCHAHDWLHFAAPDAYVSQATLSDDEEDPWAFDRHEHLGVLGDVRWLQGMPPDQEDAAQEADTAVKTCKDSRKRNKVDPLMRRRGLTDHALHEQRVERLRSEFRLARSGRLDVLLVDRHAQKPVAALTLVQSPQRYRHRAPLRRGGNEALGTPSAQEAVSATTYVISAFTHYVAPLWRYLREEKAVLVDMDSTLVDNAITLPPELMRRRFTQAFQRHEMVDAERLARPKAANAFFDSSSPAVHAENRDGEATELLRFLSAAQRPPRCPEDLHFELSAPITYRYTPSCKPRLSSDSDALGAEAEEESASTLSERDSEGEKCSEVLFVRPALRQLLHRLAIQWGIPVLLVTKSTHARTTAVLRGGLDPCHLLFVDPARQILTADDVARWQEMQQRNLAACAGEHRPEDGPQGKRRDRVAQKKNTQEALLWFGRSLTPVATRATKDAPSRRTTVLGSARHKAPPSSSFDNSSSPFVTHRDRARCVCILDDAPQVWRSEDWPATVAIAPYTLTHVDPTGYLDDNGYISSLLLSRLYGTKCVVCPRAAHTAATAAYHGGVHCVCSCSRVHKGVGASSTAADGDGTRRACESETRQRFHGASRMRVEEAGQGDGANRPPRGSSPPPMQGIATISFPASSSRTSLSSSPPPWHCEDEDRRASTRSCEITEARNVPPTPPTPDCFLVGPRTRGARSILGDSTAPCVEVVGGGAGDPFPQYRSLSSSGRSPDVIRGGVAEEADSGSYEDTASEEAEEQEEREEVPWEGATESARSPRPVASATLQRVTHGGLLRTGLGEPCRPEEEEEAQHRLSERALPSHQGPTAAVKPSAADVAEEVVPLALPASTVAATATATSRRVPHCTDVEDVVPL